MSVLRQISGCENAGRKADVLFVHGLGGDPFTTWRHGKDDSTSWPHWLGSEFPDVGVWSLGYAASPSKWIRPLGWLSKGRRNAGHSAALPDRATQVLDLMVLQGLGQRPTMFICHSLGGLLAKQLLRKADDASDPHTRPVAANTRAVLFLATPHAGAALASLANRFRLIFGATVSIEDLRAHDAHLRDLYEWYRNHAPQLRIETRTYYELRGIKGILPIVNPTSAHPGVGADPVGLDEDHGSIVKPRTRDAQVCCAARDLLRNHVLASRPAPALPPQLPPHSPSPPPHEIVVRIPPAIPAGVAPRPVPHELPPAAEKFFGRQPELKNLVARLCQGKSAAVVGPAGLGKTALAAEALRTVAGGTPASLAISPFRDGIVFLDLYTYHGQAEPAWNALANKLAGTDFMERSPARDRAAEACRGRRILTVIEGGEEFDGTDKRADVKDLLSVLSPQNRRLLLTRLTSQATPAETIVVDEALDFHDSAGLFDLLAQGGVPPSVRDRVLELLDGHPLALTWAGNLLARNDDDPARLVADWQSEHLPRLSDPIQAEHTLKWLFLRSVRGLDDTARKALAAASLLARAPFPLAAVNSALSDSAPQDDRPAREALKSLAQRGLLRRCAEDGLWQFTHVLAYRFARSVADSDPVLCERLGRWLHAHLTKSVASDSDGDRADVITRLLQHASALLPMDEDRQLWDPLANALLYNVHGRLTDLGQLPIAALALAAATAWFDRLPSEEARQPNWLRERSSLLIRRGDVLREQGDLAGALAAYRESLAVAERLAAADPSNATWQRDLSVSKERIGDVLRAQGDLAGALAAYRESLAVAERLAAADPSNATWQRDLSISQNKIGDVLREQGDLAGALAAYRESLAVAERLAAADPSNATWQRDLSISQNKIGDVLREQGDLAGALAAYRESLAVRKRLAAADPSNATWQRDLSVSQERIGDVLREQGDLAGALAAYRESLAVAERLAAADPSNATWQRDLSISQDKIGDVLRAQGDLAGALAAYRESLAVAERLAAADPSNATWQRDLSISQDKIGDVLREQGDLAGALAAYRESLAVAERLAAADPSNATWQRDLSISQNKIGDVLRAQGDLAGALAAYRESLAVAERLAAADPSNATWQRDLSISQNKIGDVLREQGDLAGALAAYRESLAVAERLAAADPSNATWQRDLSISQNKIGDVLREQGDLAGALAAYRESLAVRKRLAAADPSNAIWQRDLSYSLTQIAQLLDHRGNHAEALGYAEESLAIDNRLAILDPTNATWQRDVAVSRALVARLRDPASDDGTPTSRPED